MTLFTIRILCILCLCRKTHLLVNSWTVNSVNLAIKVSFRTCTNGFNHYAFVDRILHARRYSHGERRYKKHVVEYSPLVIRPNFCMPHFLYTYTLTIACLTGYSQDMSDVIRKNKVNDNLVKIELDMDQVSMKAFA